MTIVTLLTYAVIGLYLAAVLAIGLQGASLARDSDMFNIFGRGAKTIRASAGYLSLIGGGELITITQLGYGNGWTVLWFLGGIALGFIFVAVWATRLKAIADERRINTLSGFYSDQYGVWAGIASTVIFVLSLGALLTIQFIVGSDLLSALLGIPHPVSIIVIGAVILAYLIPAGLMAVLSTDVLRVAMMSVVLLVIVYFTNFSAPMSPLAVMYAPLPYPDNIIYFVLGFLGAISAADVWQTIFASAEVNVVRRSLILGAFAFIGFGALLAKLGMITRTVLPNLPETTPAFIAAATQVVPGILSPLMAVLVIGSVMSTADTEIWVVTTILLSNWRPSFTGNKTQEPGLINTERDLKNGTRFVLPLVTVFAMIAAYVSKDAQEIYTGLLALLSASGVAILGAMLLKPTKMSITFSLWFGLATYLVLAIYYGFKIPLLQSLLPLVVSALGYLVGAVALQADKETHDA